MTINQVFTDGGAAISGDALNTFVQTCPTYAYAHNFVGISGMMMVLQGYDTPGDGGDGDFYWNSGNTAPDDGGVTTIVPNGSPGTAAWTRLGVVPTSWTPIDASGAAIPLTLNANFVRRLNGLVLLTYDFTYGPSGSGLSAKIGGIPVPPNSNYTNGQISGPALAGASAVYAGTIFFGSPPVVVLEFLNSSAADVTNVTLSGLRMAGSLVYSS